MKPMLIVITIFLIGACTKEPDIVDIEKMVEDVLAEMDWHPTDTETLPSDCETIPDIDTTADADITHDADAPADDDTILSDD